MQRLLLSILVATSLLLFGGSYTWSTLPLFGIALLTALVNARHTFSFPHRDRAVDLTLIAASAVVALQLVPLPIALRDLLSPHAGEVAAAVRLDARLAAQRFAPLSVDPLATWHALGVLVTAVLAYWSARQVAASGVRRMARALVIVGALLAIAAIVFRAWDATRYYGLWLPQGPATQPWGPFVNRNHFAGWLLLAIPIAVGYLIAHVRIHFDPVPHRLRDLIRAVRRSSVPLLASSALIMVAVLISTLSRSSLLGLAVTAIAGWRLGRGRVQVTGRPAVAVAAACALAIVLLLAAVDLDALVARFASTLVDRPVDRVVIWRETLGLIQAFWLTGVGAGAYGTAMLVYQQSQIRMSHLGEWVHFNQAHSHYLQVPAEGGVLLAAIMVVGLVALVAAARRALRADRGEVFWIRAGAAAGLLGIAVQSIWETSLTMPANAVMCAISAALVLHRRQSDDM